jgi:hypothetical protein
MLLQVAWQDIGQLPYFRDIELAFVVRPRVIWPFLTYLANRAASLI